MVALVIVQLSYPFLRCIVCWGYCFLFLRCHPQISEFWVQSSVRVGSAPTVPDSASCCWFFNPRRRGCVRLSGV